jgi:hypothetical protein
MAAYYEERLARANRHVDYCRTALHNSLQEALADKVSGMPTTAESRVLPQHLALDDAKARLEDIKAEEYHPTP